MWNLRAVLDLLFKSEKVKNKILGFDPADTSILTEHEDYSHASN